MVDKTQPEALRLAEQYDYGDPVAHSNTWKVAVCTELRRQHARIAELEAEQKAKPCADMRRLHDLLYAAQRQTTFDAAHGAITAARIELSNLMAASPTTAEQQATTTEAALESVYAELPQPDSWFHFTPQYWGNKLRDFADRTHAARLRCKSEQARLATLWGYVRADATTKQATTKAAPTWPSEALVWEALQAYLKHDTNMEGMRAALIVGAAPQQAAPKAAQYEMDKEASNVRLDIDSNSTKPEQQRDVACSLEVGQHVGNGEHQGASCRGSEDSELLKIAARNLKYFIEHAQFSSFADKRAALNCLDVLGAPPAEQAAPKAAPGEPSDASDTLSKVCDLFQIGKLARTESTILINVENTIRFSNMLNAVEHDMFPQPDLPEDDDPYAEMDENPPAPNKWGAKDEADYVAQFRAALLARGFATPQQEAQEPATVPRFNCWSTNEGDSWFDHPADAQAIYDCLGNDAKVGDEYELTAGWKSVTARYRITEVVGDGEEYEVECISHPQGNTAPQPAPAPLSEREAFERWQADVLGRSLDELAISSDSRGDYDDVDVHNEWVAWQARAALAAHGDKV